MYIPGSGHLEGALAELAGVMGAELGAELGAEPTTGAPVCHTN